MTQLTQPEYDALYAVWKGEGAHHLPTLDKLKQRGFVLYRGQWRVTEAGRKALKEAGATGRDQ